MNKEIIDIISLGFLILIILGGGILYTLQVAEEVKNNKLITNKKIELLNTKILAIKSKIRR